VGLLATPVVFSRGGTLALWATASGLDPRKLALGLDGNVPGPLLRELLRWQDPVGQLRKWITLGERAGDPEFLEIFTAQEEWANGAVSFPGRLYVELIERLYGEDALSRGLLPGIRLDAIQAPVLNVLSKEDRIVPADATRSLADLVGKGLVETHEVPGGHIGMTVGRRARETTHAALAHFFKTHPAL
jgi:polyhydroxyalkanoate synthase